jgi:hypothetical protein
MDQPAGGGTRDHEPRRTGEERDPDGRLVDAVVGNLLRQENAAGADVDTDEHEHGVGEDDREADAEPAQATSGY